MKDAVLINDWLNEDEQREVHLVKDSLVMHKNSRSQEKLNWNIRLVFAQNYIDNLSEEVKKGQKEKIAQGWFPARSPLGYKSAGEKGHKIHIINEEKAPLVKKMFKLYATGEYSLKRLVQTMHDEGLRTRGGYKLCRGRMADIISDPFYYGKMKWNGKIYEGKQEPLISEDLFNRVQEILKSKTTPTYTKHFYLFKGMLKCSKCNGGITWEKQKGTIYGHCNKCEEKTWVKEPEVEKQLENLFFDLQIKSPQLIDWIRKALKESHKDESEYHTNSLNELNNRYEKIKKRLDNLYDDKLDEKINKDFYERKFKQYSEEKDSIISSIKKHSDSSNKSFELGNIYDLSQKAPETYQRATVEQKRQLIKTVFDNLFLIEDKLNYTYTKPFQLLHEAVSATNGSKAIKLSESALEKFEPSFHEQKRPKSAIFAELLPSSKLIRILQNQDYMMVLREKLREIKNIYNAQGLSALNN